MEAVLGSNPSVKRRLTTGCTGLFRHSSASGAPEAKGPSIWSAQIQHILSSSSDTSFFIWSGGYTPLSSSQSCDYFIPLKTCCETSAAGTPNTFWCSLSTPCCTPVSDAQSVLTFGADSTSLLFLRSQPAPSRNRPYI